MKLGIYVGSFNPVHNGHIKIVNYLLNHKYVDKVIIIATPNYWNKQNLVTLKHRINMLKFYERKSIIIDEKHNKKLYTYQVLKELKKDYPKDELYLIIGADNIVNLKLWKNLEDILKNKIIIMNRNNIDINKYLDQYPKKQFIVISDFPYIKISSTQIRNGDYRHLKREVKNYIEQNKLYGYKEE